jgi:hypothetical protein
MVQFWRLIAGNTDTALFYVEINGVEIAAAKDLCACLLPVQQTQEWKRVLQWNSHLVYAFSFLIFVYVIDLEGHLLQMQIHGYKSINSTDTYFLVFR